MEVPVIGVLVHLFPLSLVGGAVLDVKGLESSLA